MLRRLSSRGIKPEADDEAMIHGSGSFQYLPRGGGRSSYGSDVSSCSMFLLPKNEVLRSQCMSRPFMAPSCSGFLTDVSPPTAFHV